MLDGDALIAPGMEQQQREYLLRQQLAAIRKELGEGDADAVADLRERLAALDAPDGVRNFQARNNLKAMLKENWSVLGLRVEVRGSRGALAEGLFVCAEKVRLVNVVYQLPLVSVRSPAVPVTMEITTTATPISSDRRAPKIRRERMSRPMASVPNKWAELPPAVQAGGTRNTALSVRSGA